VPSTTFLFWNVNRKPLSPVVAELADEHRADIVVLAEAGDDPATLLQDLNAKETGGFHFPIGLSSYVTIYTRFSRDFLRPVFESDRVSIRRLTLPARSELLIAAVHLPSKLRWSSASQSFECGELARQISLEEDRAGHRRTVVLGDFNMNPFEFGLIAAGGLNAVMSRKIAARSSRKIQGREYRFLYNPMWSHLGDARSDTAGSYFYDSSEHVNYFWNVFDQVLMRPELAERFDMARLKIVKSVGTRSLVRHDGRPDRRDSSDHLPLVFDLDF